VRPAGLLIVLTAALLIVSAPVWAVSVGDGDLIVTFDGGIEPPALPREAPVPVAVHVAGNVRSASGQFDQLPQLRRITVAINSQGQLFDRGLPVCRARMIQPAAKVEARQICAGSLLGSGHATVQVRLGAQPSFTVRAAILAFNGPRRNGHKLILAQAYARNPPGSFILPFEVTQREGTFGTVLSTALPRETRSWAYLTHFDLKLHRVYNYRGSRHSYVSAACSAPDGFDKAVFPFAKVSYRFADGQILNLSQATTCSVAGE
jgi:hypothetical protein